MIRQSNVDILARYQKHLIIMMMMNSFFYNFSVIENFESVQTINDKWKYKQV